MHGTRKPKRHAPRRSVRRDAGARTGLAACVFVNGAPPAFDERFRETFLELVRWRRDVRHFRVDPVARETIQELIDGAALAPSVGYSQPWRFVSVDDLGRRASIIANFERANADALSDYEDDRRAKYAQLKLAGLHEAPVHLAVFADSESAAGHGLGRKTVPHTLEYSVVGAIATFWLLARARGIGVGWVSILDNAEAARTLDVPAAWLLVAYLCAGYPAGEHLTPELARRDWQAPIEEARTLYRR
jgi:5,6-dimethylbenzimidazole synthase